MVDIEPGVLSLALSRIDADARQANARLAHIEDTLGRMCTTLERLCSAIEAAMQEEDEELGTDLDGHTLRPDRPEGLSLDE